MQAGRVLILAHAKDQKNKLKQWKETLKIQK